jgi:hypothetical protein
LRACDCIVRDPPYDPLGGRFRWTTVFQVTFVMALPPSFRSTGAVTRKVRTASTSAPGQVVRQSRLVDVQGMIELLGSQTKGIVLVGFTDLKLAPSKSAPTKWTPWSWATLKLAS